MHNKNEDECVFETQLYIPAGTDASPNNHANVMPDNIQAGNLPQWKFRIKMPSSSVPSSCYLTTWGPSFKVREDCCTEVYSRSGHAACSEQHCVKYLLTVQLRPASAWVTWMLRRGALHISALPQASMVLNKCRVTAPLHTVNKQLSIGS